MPTCGETEALYCTYSDVLCSSFELLLTSSSLELILLDVLMNCLLELAGISNLLDTCTTMLLLMCKLL